MTERHTVKGKIFAGLNLRVSCVGDHFAGLIFWSGAASKDTWLLSRVRQTTAMLPEWLRKAKEEEKRPLWSN